MGTAHRKNENLAAGVTCERLFARNGATIPPTTKNALKCAPINYPVLLCSVPAGDRHGCNAATAPRAVARHF